MGKFQRKYLYHHRWQRLHKRFSRLPIDENKILFAYDGVYKQMPDNLRCMKEYLEQRGYNCVVIDHSECDKKCKNRILSQILRFFDGTEFFREYSTCKALFLSDYFFPAFACQPGQGQSVVQLWHACGAFKKWGYSTADKPWGATKAELDLFPIHNTYTHVCVSSPEVSFAYAQAFGCNPETVVPLGAPRTDVYFDSEFVKSGREQLLNKFPEIGGRKIILYAPTFRGNNLKQSYIKNMLDFERMKAELGDEYALVLKLHPITRKGFKLTAAQKEQFGDFVFDASTGVEIETALCAADIVISDYSSLVFEYALLERPMIFFAYDLEAYEKSRSFYFDYESFVPGKIVTDTAQIIGEIKRLETDFDIEQVRSFKDKFMSACDGNSTERIAKAVLPNI